MDSTVLIAEPQDARAAQYEHLVRAQGLTPLRVNSGDAAIQQLRRVKPQVIITELSLSGADGFAVLREALKQNPRPRTLVISAFREMRDVAAQQRLELGIDGLLASSSPMSSIERTLRRLLGTTAPAASTPTLPEASTDSVPPAVRFDEPAPLPLATPAPAFVRTATALTPLDQLQPASAPAAATPSVSGLLQPGIPSEAHVDELVKEVGKPFGAAATVLSFTLAGRQWLKSFTAQGGRWAEELMGAKANVFIAPILEARAPLIITQASQHPALGHHPLVTEGRLKGYIGLPLLSADGTPFGALCLLDQKPLSLGPPAIDHLKMLSRWIANEVILREEISRRAHEAEAVRAAGSDLHRAAADARAFLGAVVVASSEGIALFDANRRLIAINEPLTQITGIDRPRAMAMDMNAWTRAFGALVRDPQRFGWIANGLPAGPFALREEIELARPRFRALRWTARPIRLSGGTIGFAFAYAEVITVPDVTEDAFAIPALE